MLSVLMIPMPHGDGRRRLHRRTGLYNENVSECWRTWLGTGRMTWGRPRQFSACSLRFPPMSCTGAAAQPQRFGVQRNDPQQLCARTEPVPIRRTPLRSLSSAVLCLYLLYQLTISVVPAFRVYAHADWRPQYDREAAARAAAVGGAAPRTRAVAHAGGAAAAAR